MLTEVLAVVLVYNVNLAKSKIQPRVIGDPSHIVHYPHSAFLLTTRRSGSYVCGSSILNQRILLTAAHCIDAPYLKSAIYTGHTDRTMGDTYPVAALKPHEKYDEHTVSNDIGLIVVVKPIKLGKVVQRVSLQIRPVFKKYAVIAGWGLIDEEFEQSTHLLHHAELKVWTHVECTKFISNLPKGCLCGGSHDVQKYPSNGDSGSALVVNNYIQIGVVSYKKPGTRSIVAFSNVSYYYSWIKSNSKQLYCSAKYTSI